MHIKVAINFYPANNWQQLCNEQLMEQYKNITGEGGVSFYQIGDNKIGLKFRDAKIYTYDYQKPGRVHVEKMKVLAKKGKGLSTYINKHVRENYARVR